MQALILCQRYTDAHSACESLLPGVDKFYLQAQAAWRAGSLNEAIAALQAALALTQDSPKCSQLLDLVVGVAQHDNAADAAFEEGTITKHPEDVRDLTVPRSLRSRKFLLLSLLFFMAAIVENTPAVWMWIRTGKEEGCIEECTAALQLTERCSCDLLRCRLLHRRGRAHNALGRHKKALSDCSAALQLNPAHADCLHLRHQV